MDERPVLRNDQLAVRRRTGDAQPLVNSAASSRRVVLAAWLLFGAGMALQAWLTWFAAPAPRLAALAEVGPGSNPQVTAAAVALAWITMAASLTMLTSRSITPAKAVAIICYAGLALLYINVMRERTYYGDFDNYLHAATSLREHAPLPPRYFYPLLWASALAPLTPLGEAWVFALAWTLNLASTVLCFVLLSRVLERYGFSQPLACVVTLAAGVVNVPILRTLGYAQINMHVFLFVLLALVWYPRFRIASAIALAVATNLKISPLALAIVFLWVRDWRWLTWFAVAVVAIGVWPGLVYGWDAYAEVFTNLRNMREINGLAFREASIDSFAKATANATGLHVEALVWPLRVALAGACLVLASVHVRRGTFTAKTGQLAGVVNAMPALLVLMVMVSPVVWEHHPVFLALSYVVIATVLKPADWPLFGLAYFLEFLMPTFDFYPWSYGRLISPLILLVLAWRRRADGQSAAFDTANRWLTMPAPPPLR
jgi:hypothetical protein